MGLSWRRWSCSWSLLFVPWRTPVDQKVWSVLMPFALIQWRLRWIIIQPFFVPYYILYARNSAPLMERILPFVLVFCSFLYEMCMCISRFVQLRSYYTSEYQRHSCRLTVITCVFCVHFVSHSVNTSVISTVASAHTVKLLPMTNSAFQDSDHKAYRAKGSRACEHSRDFPFHSKGVFFFLSSCASVGLLE